MAIGIEADETRQQVPACLGHGFPTTSYPEAGSEAAPSEIVQTIQRKNPSNDNILTRQHAAFQGTEKTHSWFPTRRSDTAARSLPSRPPAPLHPRVRGAVYRRNNARLKNKGAYYCSDFWKKRSRHMKTFTNSFPGNTHQFRVLVI